MSQSIEEKIVEMRFDYKQFEEGAGKSIDTLSKLEKAIDNATKKDFVDMNAAAKAVDLSHISEGMRAIERSSSAMGIVTKRVLENLTDSAYSFATGGLGKITQAIGFVKNSIVSGGLNRAMKLEDARFTLSSLFNDAQKVEAIMQNVNDAVSGTRFGLDAAASAAAQFASSGIEAGEAMETALGAVTGVASLTNSEYEDIARVFTGIAGTGKVLGQDLIQMSSRGMNAAAAMATYFTEVKNGSREASDSVKQTIEELTQGMSTITEVNIRELISSPKTYIPAQLFLEAMNGLYKDAAFKANETFKGSFANLKSAFARIGEGFFTPLYERNSDIVKLFNDLREKVNEFKSALVFDPQVNNEYALMKQLSDGVLFLARNVSEFVKSIDVETVMMNFYTALQGIKDVMHGIWSIVGPVAKAIRDAFWNQNLVNGIDAFLSSLENLLHKFRLSDESSKNLYYSLKGVFDLFGTIAGNLFNVVGALTSNLDQVAEGFGNLLDVILGVTGDIGKFLTYISELVDESEIMEVIFNSISNIIKLLTASFKESTGYIKAFYNSFKESMAVKGFIVALYEIWKLFTGQIKSDISVVTGGLYSLGLAFYNLIPQRVIHMFDLVVAGLTNIKEAISNISLFKPVQVYAATLDGTASEMAESVTLLDIIIEKIDNFINFVNNLFPKATETIYETGEVVQETTSVFDPFIDRFEAVKEALSNFDGTQIIDSFKNIVDAALWGSQGFETIKNSVLGALIPVYDTVKYVFGGIVYFIYNLYDKFSTYLVKNNISISPESILGILTGVSIIRALVALTTLLNGLSKVSIVKNISSMITGLVKVITEIGGVATAIKKYFSAKAMMETVKSLSLLMVTLTAVIAVLSVIPYEPKKIIAGIGGISVLLIEISGLLFIMSKFTYWKTAVGVAVGLALVAASLSGVMFAFLKLIERIPNNTNKINAKMQVINNLFIGIGGILTLMTVSSIATSVVGGSGIGNILTWIGMSIALSTIVKSLLKIFELVIPKDYKAKLLILGGLVLGVAGLSIAMGLAARFSAGSSFLALTSLIGLAVLIHRVMLTYIEILILPIPKDYDKRLSVLRDLFVLVGGLLLVMGGAARIGGGYKFFGVTLLGFSMMLSRVIKTMNSVFKMTIPDDYVKRLLILFSTVGVLIGEVALASKLAGNAKSLMGTLIGFSLMLLTVTGTLFALTIVPWPSIIKAITIFGAICVSMSVAFKGIANIKISDTFKSIIALTATIAVLVVSLGVLAMTPWKDLLGGAISLGIVLLALSSVFKNINHITGKIGFKNVIAFGEMIGVILALAVGLNMLAGYSWASLITAAISMSLTIVVISKSMEKISKLQSPKLENLAILGEIILLILSLGASISMVAAHPWNQILTAMLAVTVGLISIGKLFSVLTSVTNPIKMENILLIGEIIGAIFVIGKTLSKAAKQPWNGMIAAAMSISAVMYMMGAIYKLIANTNLVAQKENMILFGELIGAVIFIAASLNTISKNDWGSILASTVGLSAVITTIGFITKLIINLPFKTSIENIYLVGALSVGLSLLGASLSLLAKNNWVQILTACAAIIPVMFTFYKICKSLLEIDAQPSLHSIAMVGAAAIAIAAIGTQLQAISKNNWYNILAACFGMQLAIKAVSGLIKSMAAINTNSGFNLRGFIPMGIALIAAIGIVAAIGYELEQLKDVSSIRALATTKGISFILDSLGDLILKLSNFDISKDKLMPMLGTFSLAIGSLFLIMANLKTLGESMAGPIRMIAAAVSMGVILNMIASSMWILQHVEIDKKNLESNISMLTSFVVACLGLIVPLKTLGEANTSMSSMMTAVAGLSAMLLSITGAMMLLRFIKIDDKTYSQTIGLIIAFTLSLLVLTGPLKELSKIDPKSLLSTVGSMVILLGGMVLLEGILGLVGKVAKEAMIGAGALVGIALILSTGLLILGVIFGDPTVMSFIDQGVMIFEKIGEMIGALFGGIVGKFSEAALGGTGSGLAAFAQNAAPFFNLLKNFDSNIVEASKNLCSLIVEITAANLLAAIERFVNFATGDSLNKFGKKLSDFGTLLITFRESIKGLKEKDLQQVELAVNILRTLVDVSKSIPSSGGWVDKIIGNNDIDNFGKKMSAFGSGLRLYVQKISHFTEDDIVAVETSAQMLSTMTDAAYGIPNDTKGTLMGFVYGNTVNLSEFGRTMSTFGYSLTAFASSISNLTEDDVVNTQMAAEMLYAVADSSKSIDTQGGILGFVLGDADLAKFSNQLPGLGMALTSFAKNAAGLSNKDVTTAVRAVDILGSTIQSFDKINISVGGGLNQADELFEKYGTLLVKFADALGKYYDKVKEIDTNRLSVLTTVLNNLVILAKDDSNVLLKLSDSLVKFADKGINDYINKFITSNQLVSTTISQFVDNTVSVFKSTNEAIKFSDAASKNAETYLNAMLLTMGDEESQDKIRSTVDKIVKSFDVYFRSNDNLERLQKIGRTVFYQILSSMETSAEKEGNKPSKRDNITSNIRNIKREINLRGSAVKKEYTLQKRYASPKPARRASQAEQDLGDAINNTATSVREFIGDNINLESILDKLNTTINKLGFSIDGLGGIFESFTGFNLDSIRDFINGQYEGGAREWWDNLFAMPNMDETVSNMEESISNAVSEATSGMGDLGSDIGSNIGLNIGDEMGNGLETSLKNSKSDWLSILKEHADKIVAANPELFKTSEDVINHLMREENRDAFIKTMQALTGNDISSYSIEQIDSMRKELANLYSENDKNVQISTDRINSMREEIEVTNELTDSTNKYNEAILKEQNQDKTKQQLALYSQMIGSNSNVLGQMMALQTQNIKPDLTGGQYISDLNQAMSQIQDQLDTSDLTVQVTPVVNMDGISSLQNQLDGNNMAAMMNKSMNISARYANDSLTLNDLQTALYNSMFDDSNIINGIGGLQETLDTLTNKVDNLQIVLDSGELVGAITPQIDAGLGTLARRKARS